MKTVYKYALAATDVGSIPMPKGAKLLQVHMQCGEPKVWARVDTEAPMVARKFRIAGTGHDLGEDADGVYLGSFQTGMGLVFHVFDLGEAVEKSEPVGTTFTIFGATHRVVETPFGPVASPASET